MKRFDYDDEDFQDDNLFPDTDDDDDEEYEEDYDDIDYAEVMKKQEAIAYAHLNFAYFEMDQGLLLQAVEFAKKSTWFFSWRSKEKQLEIIAKTYRFLRKLLTEEEKKNA